jgi:LPXTG-motif cell wall-anchored protein
MNIPLRVSAVVGIVATALVIPAVGRAAVDPANPCNVQGWFVNPDEADREPARALGGFTFEGADLIHHDAPAGLTTAALSSGDFTASPAPDQPSFFSVEVSGTDGGYATLRYNRLTHLWEVVTGGQFYADADPDKLVDLPPVKRSHTVVRFGVGYTKSPPGTVKTTVTAVSFQGKAFTFLCPSPVDPSPSQSPSATLSPTPSASQTSPSPSGSSTATTSASPSSSVTRTPTSSPSRASQTPLVPADAGDSGRLPTTGASLPLFIAAGAALVVAGGLALFVARKRRRRVADL